MIAQEVSELRKKGELKKAYNLALSALEEDPENIWNKRALAWVFYDLLKNTIERNELEKVPKILSYIQNLGLPESESMLFENIAWKVGKILFMLKKGEHVDYALVNRIFDEIKTFPFPKPSISYTFLYKAFHKNYQNWNRYLEFAIWWDFRHFQQDDFEKEELDNGRRLMSIVQQAYIAYSKKLLQGPSNDSVLTNRENFKKRLEEFLPKLEKLIEEHPEYQYPIYYQAKLLHAIGEETKALDSIIPFARQKNSEFWVWSLLAEIVSDDDKKLACLAKALTCKTEPEYVLRVREHMASNLIDRDFLQEAKTEIKQVLKIREAKDWKKSELLKNWINSDWYAETESRRSNNSFYHQWVPGAENLLYKDIDETTVIVEYVNREKKVLNFIDEERNTGFFNYNNELDEVEVGDILNVKFADRDGDYYSIYTAEKISKSEESPLIKSFSGNSTIIEEKTIGFVDDVFLPPDIVRHYKIRDGQNISGSAMPSYDKTKEQWSWEAYHIDTEK